MPENKVKLVTFWLRPETASLVEQCMAGDVFPSLSDFFETALVVFQEHSKALIDYIEQEEAKGFTHDKNLWPLENRNYVSAARQLTSPPRP